MVGVVFVWTNIRYRLSSSSWSNRVISKILWLYYSLYTSNYQKNSSGRVAAIYLRYCSIAHQVYTQEFNHNESVRCSIRVSKTSRCLDGDVYRKLTDDIQHNNHITKRLFHSTCLDCIHILTPWNSVFS